MHTAWPTNHAAIQKKSPSKSPSFITTHHITAPHWMMHYHASPQKSAISGVMDNCRNPLEKHIWNPISHTAVSFCRQSHASFELRRGFRIPYWRPRHAPTVNYTAPHRPWFGPSVWVIKGGFDVYLVVKEMPWNGFFGDMGLRRGMVGSFRNFVFG